MALLDTESTQYSGAPAYVYAFEADGQFYYLTSQKESISFGGNTYVPSSGITHGNVVRADAANKIPEVVLRVAEVEDVVQDNCFDRVAINFTVTIYKIQPGGSATWWTGKIEGGKATVDNNGNWVDFRVPSLLDAELERAAPWVTVLKECQHFLFDDYCRLTKEDWGVPVTVVSYDGTNLVVTHGGGFPTTDYFVRGTAVSGTGEVQMILEQNPGGTDLTLFMPFRTTPAPAPADIINIYPGCSRTIETCVDVFDNRPHFGGAPMVPVFNVLGRGIRGLAGL